MENSLLKHLSGLHGMVDRNLVAFIVGDVDLARRISNLSQSPTVLLEVEDEFDSDKLAEDIRKVRRDEDDAIVIVAGNRLLDDSFIRAFADYTLASNSEEESRADETWRRIDNGFEFVSKTENRNFLDSDF